MERLAEVFVSAWNLSQSCIAVPLVAGRGGGTLPYLMLGGDSDVFSAKVHRAYTHTQCIKSDVDSHEKYICELCE